MWLVYVADAPSISRNYGQYAGVQPMAEKAAKSMVSSHMDYCNSLLYQTKRQTLVDIKLSSVAQCTILNSVISQLSYLKYTRLIWCFIDTS